MRPTLASGDRPDVSRGHPDRAPRDSPRLRARGAGEPDAAARALRGGRRPRRRAGAHADGAGRPERHVPLGAAGLRARPRSRNIGWRAATAPLVAFTDDDCRPAPDWLERLLAPRARGRRAHPAGAHRARPGRAASACTGCAVTQAIVGPSALVPDLQHRLPARAARAARRLRRALRRRARTPTSACGRSRRAPSALRRRRARVARRPLAARVAGGARPRGAGTRSRSSSRSTPRSGARSSWASSGGRATRASLLALAGLLVAPPAPAARRSRRPRRTCAWHLQVVHADAARPGARRARPAGARARRPDRRRGHGARRDPPPDARCSRCASRCSTRPTGPRSGAAPSGSCTTSPRWLARAGHDVTVLTTHRAADERGRRGRRSASSASWRPPDAAVRAARLRGLPRRRPPSQMLGLAARRLRRRARVLPGQRLGGAAGRVRLGGPPVVYSNMGIPTRRYLGRGRYRLPMHVELARERGASARC